MKRFPRLSDGAVLLIVLFAWFAPFSYAVIPQAAIDDIFGTADSFQFVHQTKSGNCEIRARVLTQQGAPVGGFAKAGVMIRETTEVGAKSAQMVILGTTGNRFHFRSTTNGPTINSNSGNDSHAAPYWVKLKRSGKSFSAYRSDDGSNWVPVGSAVDIEMSSTVKIGLCVSSNNAAVLNTATFDQVHVQENEQNEAVSWNRYH